MAVRRQSIILLLSDRRGRMEVIVKIEVHITLFLFFQYLSGICNFDCFLALALVPLILTMMIRLDYFMKAVSAPKGS